MASFFEEVVGLTKASLDESAQLEKDAIVLTNRVERNVKGLIKNTARTGGTSVVFDMNKIHVDFMSKYSVEQLLFDKITDSYVPIAHRLFFTKYTPFKDFMITETNVHVFLLDWSHGLVKQEPVDPIATPPTNEDINKFLSEFFPFLGVHPMQNID
jgi:hypothetical protein